MTLFEAQPYDPARGRKKRQLILAIVGGRHCHRHLVVDVPLLAGRASGGPVLRCAAAAELREGLRRLDARPRWKQHPERVRAYPYNDFLKDWGPGSEWGIIKSHHIDGAAVPKGHSGSPFATASGVVVVVTVNDRIATKRASGYRTDNKTLGFSPY